MNDLVREVGPLTRAIIWLAPKELSPLHPSYQSIDYLLNGLVTASLDGAKTDSKVLVGENYNHGLYVFMVTGEINTSELKSFFTLVQKDLKAEEKILVVDDQDQVTQLRKLLPKELISRLQVYK